MYAKTIDLLARQNPSAHANLLGRISIIQAKRFDPNKFVDVHDGEQYENGFHDGFEAAISEVKQYLMDIVYIHDVEFSQEE